MNRFDFEQQIMGCWQVVDDLDLLVKEVCDGDLCRDEDRLANVLLGMKELYSIKFHQMFNTFEGLVRERAL